MGYFSFSMTFVIIIGGACFFLMGCSPTPKRLVDVADIPSTQSFVETDCEIAQKRQEFEEDARRTEMLINLKTQENIKELEKYRRFH